MEKILSITIPAYNVEKYLDRCLQSFEVPEILDKIEILIINDGSKDKTPDIAQKYCDKYPETYFLYNKENGGHGSGINYGIRYATGKYFKVVDGDDWLNTEELPAFVQMLEQSARLQSHLVQLSPYPAGIFQTFISCASSAKITLVCKSLTLTVAIRSPSVTSSP